MPRLSVIVIVHNMRREAPRTLHSLSTAYQRDVAAEDYEVVVVENGSSLPLDPAEATSHGDNFRYVRIEDASPSPAAAINGAVAQSSAPAVGIMIDGARIATPGAIALGLRCLAAFERPVIGTLGFHLGADYQPRAVEAGYDAAAEDLLLDGIDWREDGYRLFEIAALAGSSKDGWFGPASESNLLFMPREVFDELGGYDERFDLPGGGLVNLDFYRRAAALEETDWLRLLGEATFHQVHGGTATNTRARRLPALLRTFRRQYEEIRGERFSRPTRRPTLIGTMSPQAQRWLAPDAAGEAPASR
jgi:glycosyltransferase involved in cell wall biosynthesis